MNIKENQLDNWVRGNAAIARGAIVDLVARLVYLSCPGASLRRFPLSDSIGQTGSDGELETDSPYEPFIPKGHSIWEIGTSDKARDKASEDYRNRTKNTPVEVRKQATFIVVTPLSAFRSWPHDWTAEGQKKWIEDRKKRGEWKDIKVIDGTQLVDWLSQWPGVQAFMAAKMGMPAGHIETPEQRWSLIRSYGEPPPLTPAVFLANRESILPRLEAVFNGSVQRLKLQSHFQGQLSDLVSAWIGTLGTEKRIEYGGKCLLVSKQYLRKVIDTVTNPHVIIANGNIDDWEDEGTEIVQRALQRHHALIFEGLPGGIQDPTATQLPNPKIEHIRDTLKSAGYPDERARSIAQKCDGNLKTLVKLLQRLSTIPEWTQRTEAAELAVAQLLGSLRDSSDADKNVAETLSGKPFGEWIGALQTLLTVPDTPLTHRNGVWKVISRYEVWHSLGDRLFDRDLDRFKEVALKVLGENDPQFDLKSNERYAAAVHGKVLKHSTALRDGIADTLALLGSYPRVLSSCTSRKAEATAALAIRELLSGADWLLWASLNDHLPLLAEASPVEFLKAVESALDEETCPFDEVFKQEGGDIFGRNYTTGLLWALETLAWEPNYLSRVTLLLGLLAQRDPGGTWANRPINSLITIFLPWHPQTCASVKMRFTAIETLSKELPNIAWKLLLALLPSSHQTTMGTRKPKWRESIPSDEVLVTTNAVYWEQVIMYSKMSLAAAKSDPQKLIDLIQRLQDLPLPIGDQLLECLTSDSVVSMPETERVCIWNELTNLISQHRKFADASWAIKEERLKKAVDAANSLAPESPFYRYQRLFTDRDFELYEENDNFEEQRKKLDRQRAKAVRLIYDEGGTELIFKFASVVDTPWLAGLALGSVEGIDIDTQILPAFLDSDDRSLSGFCGGFVKGRFYRDSWSWVDSIDVSTWKSSQKGIFLSYLPFTQEAWDRSTRLLGKDEFQYWSRTTANAHEAKTNVTYAIDRLIEYGRAFAAVRCLSIMLFKKERLDWDQVVRVLDAGLHSTESPNTLDVHSAVEAIKALQKSNAPSPADLMRIEWAYLPILDEHYGVSPKFLNQRLAMDPEFFCEIIRMVFKSTNEAADNVIPDSDRASRAKNAYQLLDGWKTPPGTLPDGGFDGKALHGWIERVRYICAKSGHLKIAEQRIGHVLRYAPPDSDDLWIHRSVAEELNAKEADQMRIGFRVELFNSRGVTVSTGGKAEIDLASDYRRQAEQLEEHGYHRLAQTMRDLASEYDYMAEQEAAEDFLDSI